MFAHDNLKAMHEFISRQIEENTYYFTRKNEEEISKYMESITLQQLISLWDSMKTRSLDIHVASLQHEEEYAKHDVKDQKFEKIKETAEYWDDIFSAPLIKK